jgi:holo-[acyl-carrier protein] synthase
MSDIIGIGTDITECLRIARMIERHGELFIDRVYTPEETKYCQSRKQATQHFTGRWAAKEAILKALGTGWRRGISWRDIEVRNELGGKPIVAVRGGAKDVVEKLGISEIQVSISHCRTHATACAIAVGKPKSAALSEGHSPDGL